MHTQKPDDVTFYLCLTCPSGGTVRERPENVVECDPTPCHHGSDRRAGGRIPRGCGPRCRAEPPRGQHLPGSLVAAEAATRIHPIEPREERNPQHDDDEPRHCHLKPPAGARAPSRTAGATWRTRGTC